MVLFVYTVFEWVKCASYQPPTEYNPDQIHVPYADAMTDVLLHSRQANNQFNKRQFGTMLSDTNYYPPKHDGKTKCRPHYAGEGITCWVVDDIE